MPLLLLLLLHRLVSEEDSWSKAPSFLTEVMLASYERRKSQREVINDMPLYPTEAVLFDEKQIPSVHFTGRFSVLPAPAPELPSAAQACIALRATTVLYAV